MGNGIHARCRRNPRRNRPAQLRVGNHQIRSQLIVDDHVFDHFLRVNQSADIGDLTGCTRGSGYRRKGQSLLRHVADAAVSLDRIGVRHQQTDRLGKVNAAAAAHGYKQIRGIVSCQPSRPVDIFIGGVGLNLRKQPCLQSALFQNSLYPSGNSRRRDPGVGNDHHLLSVPRLQQLRQLLNAAGAEHDIATRKKAHYIPSLSSLPARITSIATFPSISSTGALLEKSHTGFSKPCSTVP